MKRNGTLKQRVIVMIMLSLAVAPVFGQEAEELTTTKQTSNTGAGLDASAVDASRNIMLARSSAQYRVTAGDVYTLAYAAGGTPVSYIITVDNSYRIRVSNLGVINGAGKTFMQLKNEVETIVANNYPLSGVQLVLTQPSIFTVHVKGEVGSAGEVSAWGLSRLSTLAGGNLTGRASIRDVTVRSLNGQSRSCDLFKAVRMGDLSQDPYLRPGDEVTFNRVSRIVTINGAVERAGRYQLLEGENLSELIGQYGSGFTAVADKTRITLTRYVDSGEISGDITILSEGDLEGNYPLRDLDVIAVPAITALRPAVPVNRLERTITVSGSVRRPGTYELMPHENLKELIEVYADGFTAIADPTRLELVRYVDSDSVSGEKINLNEYDVAGNFELRHYDSITVPSIANLRSVIFVEGAVNVQEVVRSGEGLETKTVEQDTSALLGTARMVVPFNAGEDYASLVRRNRLWFGAVSDTQNAYIIRRGRHIPINLNPMLYDATYRSQERVEDGDTLIVPFRQYFVTVAGAVVNPGRFPYIPDRDWEYYIGLAGGFRAGQNANEAIVITDLGGRRKKKSDAITPETTITASTNHALYYFNQYAPVITTILTVVSTIFSVQAYVSSR